MTNVLITGGAGFLGQYLIPHLAEAGCRVTVVDLQPPRLELTDWQTQCTAIHYGVDITRPETLAGHLAGIEVVYHLAGVVSFWRKHAKLLHDVNVTGTRNVLTASREAGVRRVIHISSVAAIGYNNRADAPIDETFDFSWDASRHKHYMYSKHLAELEVGQHVEQGEDAVIINPGLMWGPGDLVNSAKLIRSLAAGKLPACPPGGTNIVDVRDVARGLVALLGQGRSGERYILGGDNIPFREVYDVSAELLGVMPPRRMLPRWLKPILYHSTLAAELLRSSPPPLTSDNVESSYMFRYFSSAKAERELGWKREISFRQMMEDAIHWLRENGQLN